MDVAWDQGASSAAKYLRTIAAIAPYTEELVTIGLIVANAVLQTDGSDELIQALTSQGFEEAAGSPGVVRLYQAITGHKPHLQKNAQRSRLANLVLPSFEAAYTRTDVALELNAEGVVTNFAPVAVLAILTDLSKGQPFCFQMSRGELSDLLDELQKVQKQLEA